MLDVLYWLFTIVCILSMVGGFLAFITWLRQVASSARDTVASMRQRRYAAEARKRFAARLRNPEPEEDAHLYDERGLLLPETD